MIWQKRQRQRQIQRQIQRKRIHPADPGSKVMIKSNMISGKTAGIVYFWCFIVTHAAEVSSGRHCCHWADLSLHRWEVHLNQYIPNEGFLPAMPQPLIFSSPDLPFHLESRINIALLIWSLRLCPPDCNGKHPQQDVQHSRSSRYISLRSKGDDNWCSPVQWSTLIMTAALIIASIVIEGFTPEGGGIWRVHPRGGWDAQWGPPFCSLRGGGSQQGKVGFTPLYPAVNPTPHCCQCRTAVKPKFPRVINPDSPLNDSRQLDWGGGSRPVSIRGFYDVGHKNTALQPIELMLIPMQFLKKKAKKRQERTVTLVL